MSKFFTMGILVLLTGCGASEMQLRSRAAADLACDEEAQLEKINESTTRATGCGRKLSYTRECANDGNGGVSCHWVSTGGRFVMRTISLDASGMGLASASGTSDSSSDSSDSDDDSDE